MLLQQRLEWLAQHIWEDDGGSVGEARERPRQGAPTRRSETEDNMQSSHRSAIVITHMGAGDSLVDMPWLEAGYSLDHSDWVVLSAAGWRALAEGEAAIREALERKLLIGVYYNQPQLIAVVGHRSGRPKADSDVSGHTEVQQIVRRISSLLLPAAVVGFWADDSGALLDVLGPDSSEDYLSADRELVH